MTDHPQPRRESSQTSRSVVIVVFVVLIASGLGWLAWREWSRQIGALVIGGPVRPPSVTPSGGASSGGGSSGGEQEAGQHPSKPSALPSIAADEFRPEPVTLAPRLHLLGRMPYGVAYALEGADGWAMIDSGLDADAAGVIEQVRELGLDLTKLRAILLTHAHGDHTLGARRLRELTGAKVYAGVDDAEVLRTGGPREAFFSTYSMDQISLHATPVDVELRDGDTVELGDTTITAIATPGHTPGSTCYVRTRGGSRVLFGGDTISSLQDDIGTYAVMLPPRFRGDARRYLDSLRRLRDLPAPEFVCPGHPNESRMRHGPRVTAEQWLAVLDRGIRETEEVVRRFDADGADFLDGAPKEILKGLYYLGDRPSGTVRARPVYALRTQVGVTLFDAPGAGDLVEFVRHALAQLNLDESPNVAASTIHSVVLTSHDAASTSGLAELVRRTMCQVVAPPDLAERVRNVLPPDARLTTPAEWAQSNGVSVEVVTTNDAGSPAAAYLLTWSDRRVLISGALPSALSPSSTARLRASLDSRLLDASTALATLAALRDARPQVWLPTEASFGQNANLYAGQWHAIIEGNSRLIRQFLPPG